MNGFSEPRIVYLEQKQSRTTKKKRLKSCHSKLIPCPNQCVYNLPSSVNLVQLSPIFEHVTRNAPTLRADKGLLQHLAGVHHVASLCLSALSCKMDHAGGL